MLLPAGPLYAHAGVLPGLPGLYGLRNLPPAALLLSEPLVPHWERSDELLGECDAGGEVRGHGADPVRDGRSVRGAAPDADEPNARATAGGAGHSGGRGGSDGHYALSGGAAGPGDAAGSAAGIPGPGRRFWPVCPRGGDGAADRVLGCFSGTKPAFGGLFGSEMDLLGAFWRFARRLRGFVL